MMLMFYEHSYNIVQLFISVVFMYNIAYVRATIQCARTQDEWNKASASLQCQEPNFYHCLRNENGILTQQCLQRVWIQNGMSLLIQMYILFSLRYWQWKIVEMRIWWLFLFINNMYFWDCILFFNPKVKVKYKVILIQLFIYIFWHN